MCGICSTAHCAWLQQNNNLLKKGYSAWLQQPTCRTDNTVICKRMKTIEYVLESRVYTMCGICSTVHCAWLQQNDNLLKKGYCAWLQQTTCRTDNTAICKRMKTIEYVIEW